MALNLLKLQKMVKRKIKRLNCSLCHWWSCKRRLSRIKCLSHFSHCALWRCWTYFNLCAIWNGIRTTPVHAWLQHFCMCHSCAVSIYLYSKIETKSSSMCCFYYFRVDSMHKKWRTGKKCCKTMWLLIWRCSTKYDGVGESTVLDQTHQICWAPEPWEGRGVE